MRGTTGGSSRSRVARPLGDGSKSCPLVGWPPPGLFHFSVSQFSFCLGENLFEGLSCLCWLARLASCGSGPRQDASRMEKKTNRAQL